MARKALEMTIEIGGRVAGTLGNAFRRANGDIDDLRNRSRAAQRELNRLGNEFRQGRITQTQYAESTARITGEMQRLENSQRRIKAISGTLQKGFNTGKAVASIGAIGAATATAGVAVSSLNTAATFQQQMSKVSAVSGATGADFDKLRDKSLSLSETSIFTATQVAEGMEYLALSGMKTDQILGSTEGLLNLAAAAGMDLGTAADITTDVMSAFGMKATEAGHAADVFAFAQANANTNVEQMGEAMKYAAPMANQMGWTIEETAAAMMKLADNGLKGSIAGQAFGSSVGRLSKPTKEMRKTMDALGISFFDANENMKSLPEIVGHLEDKFKGLTMKQKSSAITTLFGAEAYKHWAILLESGSDVLNKHTQSLENADGAAKKMADTMVDNYAGSLNLLKSKVETAQIKFMSPVLPVFQDFFDGIAGNIDDNMGAIEKAGKATAKIFRDITAPFSTAKPIKPKITPDMDPTDAQNMMIQYGKDLKKYNMFKDMDLGDKVIYMLDTATDKMEAWLGGSGGEAMTRIFSKLGEIAFKAWLGAFTGSLKAAKDNLMDGNIGGAVGMGAAAWMMGGGLMVKGAIGAGKWGKDIYKSRRATTLPPPPNPTPTPSSNPPNPMIGPSRTGTITRHGGGPAPTPSPNPFVGPSRTGTINRYGGSPAPSPVPPPDPPSRGSKILSKVGKAGKFAGKALVPLNIAMEAYNISKSDDKVKATSESVGGLAGGAGGAKIGAAIGTAIAPGIGTAVGGILGGAVGYFGGKWFGGKAVDTVREGSSATAKSAPTPTTPKKATESKATTTQTLDTAPLNASATKLAATFDTTNAMMANLSTSLGQVSTTVTTSFTSLQTSASTTAANMDNLTMYSGHVSTDFVTSFYSLKTSTELSSTNMSTLAATIGQANGWISSIQGIQSAANNVITALNSLKTRIDNVQIPTGGGASSRRTQYE